MDNLQANLKASIGNLFTDSSPYLEDVLKLTNKSIEELYNEGKIAIRNESSLSGLALQFRVKKMLRDMGYDVGDGRSPDLEDLILKYQSNYETKLNIVIEVKSGKKPQVSRDDLRQLDDWIFDLSGEEDARKWKPKKIGGPNIGASQGVWIRHIHPTPHKGVMIYNGPTSKDFPSRSNECINPNDVDFVTKRNFCIIPFSILIRKYNEIKEGDLTTEQFWEEMHSAVGLLRE